MRYQADPLLDQRIAAIVRGLGMSHISLERVRCVRSTGSKSRRTLARVHGVPKVIQLGLNLPAHYVIEVLSENFDRLSREDQVRTLIHELLHIPHSFGGGFRHHRPHVNRKTVEQAYRAYQESPAASW
ncbi:MAG: metallopeptidase [Candidatus Aenigmarchaeota archaeon]|nr:metallopeptidase [Candidatus Aenigmarchaeota archaeon]